MRLFNRGPYPFGGDGTTVCASFEGALKSGIRSSAPFRMVIDLGDLRNSLGLLMPGQSERPDSPHYADQIQSWLHGYYHPMLFDRNDVQRYLRHRLTLLPDQQADGD